MNNIKNLIFDVGGVLIGYRWEDMLTIDRGLDKERAHKVGLTPFQDESWALFDAGKIMLREVLEIHRKKSPDLYEDIEWFLTHNELMRVKRPLVSEQLYRLKKQGYNIYILSNYSEELFDVHTKDDVFWNYIDGRLVSYEVKLLKPDKKIYETLLDKYNLRVEESVFFDDRKENVEAAESLGIAGFLVNSEEELIKELKKY